jgi:hypothetical protein
VRTLTRFVLVASVLVVGCAPSSGVASPGATATIGAATPTPSAATTGVRREPADLPLFVEEQPVIDALASIGFKVDLIGGSKFEGMLGTRQRARVFIGSFAGGLRNGADVLFLDSSLGPVRVCTKPGSAPGFTGFEIFVADRLASHGEGSQTVTFAVSDRYFVQALDDRIRDVLRDALGLSVPGC